MLAILGPQSSGKSTLLNGLFGTTFPTMQSETGRYQCTKGIWMGKAGLSDTLVLDVEGTDGRERGEAEVAFEKKTSLFSLALAEILIVNMWMQDIGRNNAANLPLLKTVFEINLQLFASEKRSKTLLLFIVRDHVRQATPLTKLIEIITKDLNDIWNGITKSDQFKHSALSDFFEFQFTSLPHKLLEADKFNEELKTLSSRFNDPKSPHGYIWAQHLKSQVPADGLAMFAQSVWETIQQNKDLDLPSQREVLATFRCEEIGAAAYEVFSTKLKGGMVATLASKTIVTDFASQSEALLEEAFVSYAQLASRYLASVVEKKMESLQASLLKDLKDAWNTNVALILESATRDFESALQKTFKDAAQAKSFTSDFGQTVKTLKTEALKKTKSLLASSVPKQASWDYALTLEQLDSAMDASVAHEKEKQLKKVMDDALDQVKKYANSLDDVLELGKASMWSDIRALHRETKGDWLEELRGRLQTFDLPPAEVDESVQRVSDEVLAATKKRVEVQQERAVYRMQQVFDRAFKQDASGLPRVWKPDVDLQRIFKDALAAGTKVLDLFTVLRLEEDDDKYSLVGEEDQKIPQEKLLMTKSKAAKLIDQFTTYANASCADAQRAIDQYNKASGVPAIMVVLIILLGWNEFMYLLSNPLMLIFLITLGSAGYAVHMLGLTPVLLPIVTAAYNQAVSMAVNVINGAGQVAAAQQQQQPAASTPQRQSGKSKKE